MSHLRLPAQLLVNSFNPAAAEGVMCRDTVSVGWDGRLYDCDFNQQLALGMRCAPAAGRTGHLHACMRGVICLILRNWCRAAAALRLRCDTDREA